jgi:hypothetical protein
VFSDRCQPFAHLSFLDVSSDRVESASSDFPIVNPYTPFLVGSNLLWWLVHVFCLLPVLFG